MRQNSSPPRRYAVAAGPGTSASFAPRRASSASPAGWPNVSLYALNPSRSKIISRVGRLPSAREDAFEVGRGACDGCARPVSASVTDSCLVSS